MLRRLPQLYIGLVPYGVSTVLFVHVSLGADPQDVFHLGMVKQLGISFGMVIILTGAVVPLLWIPIWQMPGFGTVSSVIVLGPTTDATLVVLPPLKLLVARSVPLVGAIVLNAIATGTYTGAGFGPRPRDGLIIGLYTRTGWSLCGIRMAIELTVLVIDWPLGGKFGVGAVVCALPTGLPIQLYLPWFRQSVNRKVISIPQEIVP